MPFRDDLTSEVRQIFAEQWDVQSTGGVPDPTDLRLGNHAKDLEKATVLYADLDGSTGLVDNYSWSFAAEAYKAYLRCAARIISSEGGVVTAYDGDRVMAVFTGDTKNSDAVRAGMKIHYAVTSIINPELKSVYKNTNFVLRHCVGIDTSQLRAARIGVRGYNDIVWVGRSANYAAKLTALDAQRVWITKAVYDVLMADVKVHSETKADMWTKMLWTSMNKMEIYCTHFGYEI